MVFEDLDELHSAFVEPLVARYAEVVCHRRFMDKLPSQMDELVSVTAVSVTTGWGWPLKRVTK